MRVLVTGARGMLGQCLVLELGRRGHEVLAFDRAELDVTDPGAIAETFSASHPDAVANAAAYTAVDRAESDVDAATLLNTLAPAYLARACMGIGARLVHVSTDFVFDGSAQEPYREEVSTHPLGVYGRTKRDGEEAVLEAAPNALIFRTAWLFGETGQCFPRSVIRAWRAEKPLRIVSDQTGCPTYARDLARVIVDGLEREIPSGIYHAVGPEATNWHAFAVEAIREYAQQHGIERTIEIPAITTSEYPTAATRPAYSVLCTEKLQDAGIAPMRPLAETLPAFVAGLPDPV